MQLIQKARLFFQQGGSDKVYEVDLCEVGPGEYVVNFRYGRRGANLKEGTKTVFPVPLDKAQKEFDKLVNGKKRKGYADLPGSTEQDAPEDAASVAETNSGMASKVLEYLEQAAQGAYDEKRWKLSRVIWRAGELQLKAAAPHLQAIAPREDSLFNYSLAWALGRCGDQEVLPALKKIPTQEDPKTARIAAEVRLLLGTDADKAEIVETAIAKLPSSLRSAVQTQNPELVGAALEELVFSLKSDLNNFLYLLYQIAAVHAFVQPPLLDVLARVPLRPPFFRAIRYIYKAAEFRGDSSTAGLLFVRLEKAPAFFRMPKWWRSVWVGNSYVDAEKELVKEDSKLAFSQDTRNYLLRRSNRFLDKLARTGAGYPQLARYILLQYRDGEGYRATQEVFWSYRFENNRWRSIRTHRYYPEMGNFLLLYHILYGNSTRFKPGANGARWTYRAPATPSDPPPENREEIYPHLWDEAPEDLKALLIESRCRLVVEFAAKAFKVNPHRSQHTDLDFIRGLLGSPYPTANELGLELARETYDPAQPDKGLLRALVNCVLDDARELGLQWIAEQQRTLFRDAAFLADLITSHYSDVRKSTSDRLKVSFLDREIREAAGQKVLATLIDFPTEDPEGWEPEWISAVIDLVLIHFADALNALSAEVIVGLATHPWEAMQLLAGQVMLKHFQPKSDLPEAALHALIDSEWPTARGLGAEVFGQLPLAVLRERKDIVAGFCVSRHPEIRAQAAPLVTRLVAQDAEFARGLLQLFVPALWRKESYDGVHADLSNLILVALKDHLGQISPAHIWKLIDSDHRPAHELGHYLLTQAIDPESLPLSRLVGLGSHELRALRRYTWDYFNQNIPRIKYERESALKLLDASWEDSREFAREYFGQHFGENDWTPELLVSICDSVRAELQTFGRQLITRFFQEKDGEQYLLKLSQHPKTELQLFVTNYLERFAGGQPDRIVGLDLYFRAVLGQVRKGRAAKERIFAFLHKEARASESVAVWFIPLLNHLVLTISYQDKAHCIRILTDLRYRYPHLESSLTVQTFEHK
ncbi:MAG: WGR domain-containing protein [Bacteroidota bacterium]